jgi:hypothetical protein
MKKIDNVFFYTILFIGILVFCWLFYITPPVHNQSQLEEVPQQEVVVEFILRNPQEGQFAIRYEVYHNDRRVGSVHTQPLTPGIYHLEVE